MIAALVVVAFLALAYWLHASNKRPPNFPSGPLNLPVIGAVPFFKENLYETFDHFHKKYGKAFSFKIGSNMVLVLTDFNDYKDASSKDELLFRPDLGAFADFRFPDEHRQVRGVFFSNGEEWHELRRFTLRHLRDFGFGKNNLEGSIQEEVERAMDLLREDVGKEVSLSLRLNVFIVNALWNILTGERLPYNSPRMEKIVKAIDNLSTNTNISGPLAIIPAVKYIAPGPTGYSNAKEIFTTVYDLISELFESHLETYDENVSRDFMDIYIKEVRTHANNKESIFFGEKGRQNMSSLYADLFIGGSETTATTINWTLLYLCLHPDKQRKLQKELDEAVGRSRLPSLEDRLNLPYLEAISHEVLRLVSIAFATPPRMAGKDCVVAGYNVPKGTWIFTFLHHILHDPNYWKEPNSFMPERFLDEQGKFKLDDRFIPFGLGKRQCLGKALANTELILFLGAMFQRFSFSLPEGKPLPDLKGRVGILRCAPIYSLIIKERE